MRIPKAVCAAVANVLVGSHNTLDALFVSAGAPGLPPSLSHSSKWKEWLFRAGMDTNTDSLSVLGTVLEEFMDLPPSEGSADFQNWQTKREHLVTVLEENGFRYYRGGRVLPLGTTSSIEPSPGLSKDATAVQQPDTIEELLGVLIRGLPRAMHPLTHRRKGAQTLSFCSEYDIQDLLHALLRPWVADIRPEEFTPSYAGTSTRMDFLLPKYSLVIELKYVRDRSHSTKIGNELIVDIEHYRRHQQCDRLWCVIYDPNNLLLNAQGLKTDLEGERSTPDGRLTVSVLIVSG